MVPIMAVPAGAAVLKVLSNPVTRKILKHTFKGIIVILLDEVFRDKK